MHGNELSDKMSATAPPNINQGESNCSTLRTLPRKRRPRAVGEVYITCPASQVYLNSAVNEHNAISEPIYQNTTTHSEQEANRRINRCGRLSFVRATVTESDNATGARQSMTVSTFIGSFHILRFYQMYF